jgi:DNA-binding XRE family transcriptional regulator
MLNNIHDKLNNLLTFTLRGFIIKLLISLYVDKGGDSVNLNERIKIVRKSKGISQTHVANEVGMTVSSYNMKENGRRPISTDEIENIAIALDVSPGIFFDDEFHVKLNIDTTSPA